MAFYEKTLSSEEIYNGAIITVHRDEVELINGKTSTREVVEHNGGVGVIAVDTDDYVPMIRQYRYPFGAEVLEIPAGKLERGEEPFACAVRELSEETGLEAGEFMPLGKILPSPGYCHEVLHIYLARDLRHGTAHLDADEFLSVERYPLTTLYDMVMSGEIEDAKSVIAILKAAHFLKRRLFSL